MGVSTSVSAVWIIGTNAANDICHIVNRTLTLQSRNKIYRSGRRIWPVGLTRNGFFLLASLERLNRGKDLNVESIFIMKIMSADEAMRYLITRV